MSIRIFYDEIRFRLIGSRKALKIIEKVIDKENKFVGELKFIFTSDEPLREINIQFLKHNYNTDVIAFDYCDGDIINGEIYISIDCVKRNAVNYNVSLKNELVRVMIHGVLHLTGYSDKSYNMKLKMRRMEDIYLKLLEE